MSRESLPYRPCVGVAVFNAKGQVFIGRRAGLADGETHIWQMPQGGIDDGEEPLEAAYRELYEETGIESIELLSEASDWLKYDLPAANTKRWTQKYRGQAQRWFAFRFIGDESEIRFDLHGKPEFEAWRWIDLKDTPDLIVPFKRAVYEEVVRYFQPIADDV